MIPAANGPVAGDERERRRRHDADDVDVDAEARRPGDDGGHEHVARPARVLADDDRPATTGQAMRDRPPERVGEGRLQLDVGDAADAVGAEQAGHGSAPADGDGAAERRVHRAGGDAIAVIVTWTVAGSAATSVVPVGRLAVTGTSWTPAESPVTSSVATTVEPDSRSRSAVEPPTVISTRSIGIP